MATGDFLAQSPDKICKHLLPKLYPAMFHAKTTYDGCVNDVVRASLSVLKHTDPLTDDFPTSVRAAMDCAPLETFSAAFDRARALECVVSVCTEPCSYCSMCGGKIAETHSEYYLISVLGTRWVFLVGKGDCAEKFQKDVETVYTKIQSLLGHKAM